MRNLTKEQAKNIREMNISKRNKMLARKIVRWVNNQEITYKMWNTNGRICFSDGEYNKPVNFQMDIWLNEKCPVFGPIYYVKKNFKRNIKFVEEIGKILFV